MEYYLIDYLIDEGYAITESSAYKILSVISEEFYEYLLSEAETDEQKRARRGREIRRTFGRDESERRREKLGIPEPDVETSAEIRGRIRNRKPSTRGGSTTSTKMETHTGASVIKPARQKQRAPEKHLINVASTILAADREKTAKKANSDPSYTDPNKKRPTQDPIFVDAEGNRQSQNSVAHPGQSYTYRSAKETMGQRPTQGYDDLDRDVGVGPTISRTGTSIYSGKRPSSETGSSTQKKKPQTSQPQAQRTTPSGRVRKLPRQEPTRATSARRKPQPQSPTQTSSTPQRKPTPQELERQNRPKPTNPSARVAKPVNSTRLATGITRRRPQITSIQPQNPNK